MSSNTPTPLRARPASARHAPVDWLRAFALWEVIGFHTRFGRFPVVGGLGLPLLLVITNLFNCPLADRRGMTTLVRDKVRRLFVPWLFWCAVFAAMIAVEGVRAGQPLRAVFSWDMLLFGTYTHLWFVPFAIFGGFAVGVLQTWSRGASAVLVSATAVLAGVACVTLDLLLGERPLLGRLGIWLFSLPSVPFGLALGRTLLIADRSVARRVTLTTLAVSAAAWVVAAASGAPWPIYRYAAAVTLVAAALVVRVEDSRIARVLAPLSLGIYFAHPLVMRALIAVHLPTKNIFIWALACFALTALLVASMKRTILRRFV